MDRGGMGAESLQRTRKNPAAFRSRLRWEGKKLQEFVMSLRLNLFRGVDALSSAVDLVGIDDAMHGKRVGIMAHAVAQSLGWPEWRKLELLYASFLHDCGVSTTEEHGHLVTELEWSNAQGHCERGAGLLSAVPQLAHLAGFVRWHHTRWADLQMMDLADGTREMANLIFLADRLDVLRAPYVTSEALVRRGEFFATLRTYSGLLFKPELVEALERVAQSEAFWFGLEPQMLLAHIQDMAQGIDPTEMDFADLKALALMFARIVDAKSPFTAEHSIKVAELARYIARGLDLAPDSCDQLEIASYLHDLGKLRVPDAILAKSGPLDEAEKLVMKRHSYDTYETLYRLFGGDGIARWAALHHETLSGEGYPFHLKASQLPKEARILAVADVVQALVQNRPYRHSLPPREMFGIVKQMTQAGRLDPQVVGFVQDNLLQCWAVAGGGLAEERLAAA
jgi:HD-GYP domain-containing protein (c-di-GMP phosphodiesterase class II)